MPPKKSNLGRRSRKAETQRRLQAKQTEEERASANEVRRQRIARMRAEETAERRAARLEDARLRARQRRSRASDLQRSQQNERRRQRLAERRQREATGCSQPQLCALQSCYVLIGTMTEVCRYCGAFKFPKETKGMCLANEKVKLPQLEEPPEPLKTLHARDTTDSKHFLTNIRKYNSCLSCLQMASYGAEIVAAQFMPTFKVEVG